MTFGSSSPATFYTKGDIKVTLSNESFDIDTSVYGKVDERLKERKVEVTFEPAGEWEATALAKLFTPYTTMKSGDSIFTGTDQPLVIKTVAGVVITFHAAALTKIPDIVLSTQKTMIGGLTFTCIGKDNTAWSNSASLFTVSSAAFSDATFDDTNIITQSYGITWGSTFSSLETLDGVSVSFDLSLKPLEVDTYGIVDMTFEKLVVTAKLTPVGVSESTIMTALNLQNTGVSRGMSLSGTDDLVVTGADGKVITLTNAILKSSDLMFGDATPRIGEVMFIATREFSSGVVQPLFSIA